MCLDSPPLASVSPTTQEAVGKPWRRGREGLVSSLSCVCWALRLRVARGQELQHSVGAAQLNPSCLSLSTGSGC